MSITKEVLEEICAARCPIEELRAFVLDTERLCGSMEDAYATYYRTSYVANVLQQYRDEEVSAEYLALWMRAYSRIITADEEEDVDGQERLPLARVLMRATAETLREGAPMAREYAPFLMQLYFAKVLGAYRHVLESLSEWEVCYAPTHALSEDEADLVFLFSNEREGRYLCVLREGCTEYGLVTDATALDEAALQARLARCKENGTDLLSPQA